MPPEQDANEVLTSLRHERKNGWMRRIVLAAIAVLVVFGLVRAYRRIDATAVWDALSRLPWWTPLVLLVLLVARQVLNAAPLAIFLPGVGLYRCTINDLSASTAAAFAPAPSDMVLRVAMFRSWNLSTESALAATTMNAVTFFIARFSAPLLGFALLPFLKVSPGLRLFDLLSLAVAAALIVGVLLVHRSQEWAASLGRLFGKTVRIIRRRTDPEKWAETMRGFQADMATDLSRRFPRAVLVSYAVVLIDLLMLVITLRAMGVTPDQMPVVELSAAYLFAFPLTMFPAQGLGIMDSAMIASLAQTAGDGILEPSLAALLVWRTFTVAGPFALGTIALALWKRTPPPA